MDKEQVQKWKLYDKIVARAEKLRGQKWKGFVRLSFLMDIEFVDKVFHMRLQDWIEADNANFEHDWNGIQAHLDRQNHRFVGNFTPRFAEGGM